MKLGEKFGVPFWVVRDTWPTADTWKYLYMNNLDVELQKTFPLSQEK